MGRVIKIGKFGFAENPAGLQIKMKLGDRLFLGDVVDSYRDEITGSLRLIVRHFNGDPWPFDPVANLVEVIA